MSDSIRFAGTPVAGAKAFASGDGTALSTLITGGTYGTRVHAVSACNLGGGNEDIALYLGDGVTDYLLTTKTIPANAGYTGVNGESMLDTAHLPALDADVGRFIMVPNGWTLKAACTTTVSAATLDVVAFGADFGVANAGAVFKDTPNVAVTSLTDTTITALLTAGASGSIVGSVSVANTTASALECRMYAHNGSANFLLGYASIAANAGNTNAIACGTLFDTTKSPWLNANPGQFITLPTGWSLRVQSATTPSSGVLDAVANGFDY